MKGQQKLNGFTEFHLVLGNIRKGKWNKLDILPLSEDFIKLHKYMGNVSTEAK